MHLKKTGAGKGENTLVVELIKRAQDAKFTLTFSPTITRRKAYCRPEIVAALSAAAEHDKGGYTPNLEKFLQFIRKTALILIVSVVACAALVLPAVLMLLPPFPAGRRPPERDAPSVRRRMSGRTARSHTTLRPKRSPLRGISTA